MISICIPVFNQHDMTEECITAIRENTQDCEIIIVDNGSAPPIKKPFTGFIETTVIRNEENKGFPVACNQGIKVAKGEKIVLLNNDCIVTPGWADYLLAHLNVYDLVGPCTNAISGPQQVSVEYSNLDELSKASAEFHEENAGQGRPFHRLVGFCLMIKREVIDKIGLFDEQFSPGNFEDDDYCLRAIEAGFRCGIAEDVFVHHHCQVTHKAINVDYAALLATNKKKFDAKWPLDKYMGLVKVGDETIEKAPYLIWAPPYQHNSGGIRALYELRRHLEDRGHEVRIVQDEIASPGDIVVYPEIIPGNPLNGKTVVRLVLNFPGHLGGDKVYDPSEIIFTYAPRFYPGVPILTVPIIEDFFKDEGLPRKGGCFWIGKGNDVPRIPETEGLTEITYTWPAERLELAQLFNEKEVFYSYDDCAVLITEARLCGCKVVVIPGEKPGPSYEDLTKEFNAQFNEFIRITQKAAKKTAVKDDSIHLAIGIPLSFPWVPSSFFHSFVMMDRPSFTFLHADNGHIDDLRNNLVDKALQIGATHLIMMDVDQVYHPQTITRLLSHRLPVVGALIHRRYPPFDSLMLKTVEIDEWRNGYVSIDEWKEGELVEVDATGGGCLMFNMDVFRKIPRPWFKASLNPDGSVLGEDISFCQELKAAGYRIFVDTSVPAGHLTTMVVDRNTSLLYRAMKMSKEKKVAAMGIAENV